MACKKQKMILTKTSQKGLSFVNICLWLKPFCLTFTVLLVLPPPTTANEEVPCSSPHADGDDLIDHGAMCLPAVPAPRQRRATYWGNQIVSTDDPLWPWERTSSWVLRWHFSLCFLRFRVELWLLLTSQLISGVEPGYPGPGGWSWNYGHISWLLTGGTRCGSEDFWRELLEGSWGVQCVREEKENRRKIDPRVHITATPRGLTEEVNNLNSLKTFSCMH